MANSHRKGISIKRKIFLLIFVVPAAIISVFGAITVSDSGDRIGQELFSMRAIVNRQTTNDVQQILQGYDEILINITNQSIVFDILRKDYSDIDEEDMETVKSEVLNENPAWLANVYIIGFNGFYQSSINTDTEKYSFEELQSQPWYSQIEQSDDVITSGVNFNKSVWGLFRHYITKAKLIIDHVTGQVVGVVVFEISELALEAEYLNHLINNPKDSNLFIVGDESKIVSSRQKDNLGKNIEDVVGSEYFIEQDNDYAIVYNEEQNIDHLVINTKIIGSPYYMVEYIPLSNILSPVYGFVWSILAVLMLFIMLMLILDIAVTKWIASPILELESAMQSVIDGDLAVRANIRRNDELGKLGEVFNDMVANTRDYISAIKEKEQLKLKAELDFLQAQINPHFMYNTLSSVRFMISMGKTSEAEDMLIRFSKMLRYITTKSDKHVTLGEELRQIENYIEILKIRYPDSFSISYDIPKECKDILIPSFILQPTVENAVYHNVGAGRENIKIRIKANLDNQLLTIHVTDTGKGISKERLHQINNDSLRLDDSVGLENVDSRIKLNYGEDSGITIRSKVDIGTTVCYKIHLGRGEED